MVAVTQPSGKAARGREVVTLASHDKEDSMAYFHTHDGLCFERLEDGAVEVTFRVWSTAHQNTRPDLGPIEVVQQRVTLTLAEWDSVQREVSDG